MNPRTTGVLLAVALALGAFVYFWGVRGEESRREAEAQEKRLFPGSEADEIEAVFLRTRDGVEARVERRDGRWRLVEPVDFPADEIGLDGMADTLAQMASESTLENPQALDVYGLGEDAARVRFRIRGEQEPRGLVVGDKTPVGGSSYVTTLESDEVFVVPTWRVTSLEKSLDDLREHRVVRFDRDAVQRVEARWPGGRVVLERADDGDDWRLVEPFADRADDSGVNGMLGDLALLRAEGFVDEPGPEHEQALARPEFELVLSLADDEEEPSALTFALGESLDGQQRVARGAEASLYLVPAERIVDFPRRLSAYRFRELSRFEASEAQRFELAFYDGDEREPVVVRGTRSERGWTTEPEKLAAGKAARLISELARLEAVEIEADAMGRQSLEAIGLLPPSVAVRVYGAPEDEGGEPALLAAVDLGFADSERGIAARRGDSERVFRLDYALAEHLPISLDALRNRFLSEETESEEPGADAADAGGLQELLEAEQP